MPKVTFLNETTTVEAKKGQTIKEVATEHGIPLHRGLWTWLNCRSHGLCGSCEVWVTELAPNATSAKGLRERLRGKVKGKVRLACQAQVLGDVEVRTLPGGLMFEPKQTLQWEQDPRPSAWKDRLAKANAGGDEDEEGEAKPKPAAAAAKPAAAALGGAPKPAAAPAPAPAAAAPAPKPTTTPPATATPPKPTTTPPATAAAPKPTTTPPATAVAPKPTTTPPATSNSTTTPKP